MYFLFYGRILRVYQTQTPIDNISSSWTSPDTQSRYANTRFRWMIGPSELIKPTKNADCRWQWLGRPSTLMGCRPPSGGSATADIVSQIGRYGQAATGNPGHCLTNTEQRRSLSYGSLLGHSRELKLGRKPLWWERSVNSVLFYFVCFNKKIRDFGWPQRGTQIFDVKIYMNTSLCF